MFYVYILYSISSDKFYIGQSEDPWERLAHHNNDEKDTFTAKYRPWELKAIFKVGDTRTEALKVESFIKKQKSRKLIELLIDPCFVPTGALAQLVRALDC